MNTNSEHNKRIAKNTVLLYFRLIISMAVSLYTSRIILNTLGVVDYGIYNVVGGIVTMFGFLNSAMASGTQRFLSFELGKRDFEQLRNVFSMSLTIHILIAIIIFIFAETLGLWFLNTQINIPSDRMDAARWIYQFVILSAMISLTQVPYNASIFAHERMNVYAYISIIEVVLRLIIVFMLTWISFDKLKLYAVLTFMVSGTIAMIYRLYCTNQFKECAYRPFKDKQLFSTLIHYAGWNLFGNAATVLYNQGINILLNIFFGPVVNAARAIAFNVSMTIASFVSSFQQSVNPQIVKSYASDNREYMNTLILQSSKFSFFLLFFLAAPVLLETNFILLIWLKTVPVNTAIFCRLVLINALINSFSGPLMTATQATGKIKLYQSLVGGILLLNVPISYLFLKLGYSAAFTFLIAIFLSVIALLGRLWIVKRLLSFKVGEYIKKVILRSCLVFGLSLGLPLLTINYLDASLYRFLIITLMSLFLSLITIYYIGLYKNERVFIVQKISTFLIK